jgi:hypothetical protein
MDGLWGLSGDYRSKIWRDLPGQSWDPRYDSVKYTFSESLRKKTKSKNFRFNACKDIGNFPRALQTGGSSDRDASTQAKILNNNKNPIKRTFLTRGSTNWNIGITGYNIWSRMLDSEVIKGDLESMKGYLTKFWPKSRDMRAKEKQKISLSDVGLLVLPKSREFFGLSEMIGMWPDRRYSRLALQTAVGLWMSSLYHIFRRLLGSNLETKEDLSLTLDPSMNIVYKMDLSLQI